MRQMTLTQSGVPGRVIGGTISHASTQYIDFVNFFTFNWICLTFILLILVGVELPLCVVVTLLYLGILCHVFWKQVEYKIVCFISA